MSGAIVIGVRLCADCAGYEPLVADEGYAGALTGTCDGCHQRKNETHFFAHAVPIKTLGLCECVGGHPRREAS